MAKFTLEDTIKTFTTHQAIVVYWFCKGLSNQDIADRYGYEPSWVVWQFSMVYFKLGLDRKQANGRKLHWTERRKVLREKVCPILDRLTNDDPDFLERFPLIAPNVLDGSILDLRPDIPIPPSDPYISPPEPPLDPPLLPAPGEIPPPEPPPDFYPIELYNAWLAAWEDHRRGEDDIKVDPTPPPPPPPPKRPILWGRILGMGFLVLLGCVIVGVGAFLWGRGNNANTPVPPNALSTLTIGQEISDDRVTLKLVDVRYNEGYDRVGSRVAPISHIFEFTNHSGDTLLVQFDTSYFVVTDNTGRTFECWFFRSPYAFEEWNLPLNDNSTETITTRCGDGRVPEGVTTYTLTIRPFTSLPESTWVVEVPR